MRDEELFSRGLFASELDDDLGDDVKEPDLDEDELDDDDLEDDDDEASYNPLDDYNREEW